MSSSKRDIATTISTPVALERLVGSIALHEDTPQRKHIRSVAAKLFAEKSYHEVGVAEICEAAGMARGALYHHIGSKEELLYNIAVRYMTFLVEAGEQITADMPDPVARIRLLSRNLMRTISAHINEMTVCFREINSLTGERHAFVSRQHSRYQKIWGRAIGDGVERKIFRKVPVVALKGMLGMYFYSFLWLNPHGKQAPEEIADVFCDLVFRGIASNPTSFFDSSK
ncbi:MAG: TetR/AcrR family transcriptional regulator [Pseudomonadota bacterium]